VRVPADELAAYIGQRVTFERD
ncbi:MAG: hypothetical protein RLZZ303_201, partial [Candidatus Hydrogenedentota bacterium]